MSDAKSGGQDVQWADLTEDHQCVLLNAFEESFLSDLLIECGSAPTWEERLTHVPRLAEIIERLVDQGLIEVTKYENPGAGVPPVEIPADQVHAIVSDPANWWSPEGTKPIALAPTDAGLAIYTSPPSKT